MPPILRPKLLPATYVRVRDERNWLYGKTGIVVSVNRKAMKHMSKLNRAVATTIPIDFGEVLSGRDKSIFLKGNAKRHTHTLMGILSRATGFFVMMRDIEILEVSKDAGRDS